MIRRALLALLLLGLATAPGATAAGRATETTWHGTQIKMYDAQAAGRFGTGVVVAVIDGWVDRSHPDFEGRVLQGADCTSGSCVAGQTRDSCTHGTHVAGTVASSSFGVARKATILPVRVLVENGPDDCTGRPNDVAAGIRYAVAAGADVLNLSLGPDVPGLSSSNVIPTAVAEAAAAGVVVVFSAGNEDLPVAQSYDENALVVAATGPNGHLTDYTQYGAGVSVAAPGGQPGPNDECNQQRCVTSLFPAGLQGCPKHPCYAVAAGTSMAAPHVSGIAALLLGQKPSRGRDDVVNRIRSTAHPLSGAGDGLVDAKLALGVSASTPRATTAPRPSRPAATKAPTRAQTMQPASPVATPSAAATTAPTTTPSAVPSATESSAPSTTPPPARAVDVEPLGEELPVPQVVLAVGLVTLAGSSVLTLSLSRRS